MAGAVEVVFVDDGAGWEDPGGVDAVVIVEDLVVEVVFSDDCVSDDDEVD